MKMAHCIVSITEMKADTNIFSSFSWRNLSDFSHFESHCEKSIFFNPKFELWNFELYDEKRQSWKYSKRFDFGFLAFIIVKKIPNFTLKTAKKMVIFWHVLCSSWIFLLNFIKTIFWCQSCTKLNGGSCGKKLAWKNENSQSYSDNTETLIYSRQSVKS